VTVTSNIAGQENLKGSLLGSKSRMGFELGDCNFNHNWLKNS